MWDRKRKEEKTKIKVSFGAVCSNILDI